MIIRKSVSCPGSPARRCPPPPDQESDSEQEDGDSGALDLSLPLRKRAFDEPELRQHSNPKKKIIRRYYRKSATTARSHIDRQRLFFSFPFLFLLTTTLRAAGVPAFLFHFPCQCVRPCRSVSSRHSQTRGRNSRRSVRRPRDRERGESERQRSGQKV